MPMARNTAWPGRNNTMGKPRMARSTTLSPIATAAIVAVAQIQTAERSRLLGSSMQSPHVVDHDEAVVINSGDAIDAVELEQGVGPYRLSTFDVPWLEVKAEH